MTAVTNSTDDATALRIAIQRAMLNLHTAMPCVVKSVTIDDNSTTVTVTPAIKQIEGAKHVAIPDLTGVPVITPGSQTGGLFLTVPLAPGDEGLLVFAERSIDNWQEKGGVQPPAQPIVARSHSLTDAFFIPGAMSDPKAVQNYSLNTLELRNADASVKVAVSESSVRLQVGAMFLELTAAGIQTNGTLSHTHTGVHGETSTGH